MASSCSRFGRVFKALIHSVRIWFAVFVLAFFCAQPASAQITWTGNTSTDWNTGSNWSTGSSPGVTDTIIVDQSGGNQPTVSSLVLGSFNGTGTQSGNLSISNGGNVTTSSLTQVYAGNVTVDGANSALYLQDFNFGRIGSASLSISNGGFVEANSLALFFLGANGGEGTISVTGTNSTLLISPSSNFFQGVMLGNGSITVANGGLVTLGNASNISIGPSNPAANRATALNINTGGTLQVGGTDGIQGGGVITLAGGTLQILNSTLTTTVSATLVANTTTTIDTNGLGATLSGVLSGGGGLNKISAGTLTLATTNTFTGNTTLNTGTLLFGDPGAVQNSTLNFLGGNLSFGSLTSATLGGLSGNQNLALTNNSSVAVALTLGGSNLDTTYSGNLTGNGSLTKIDAGNLTLSGCYSTYTGATTVASGNLIVAGAVGNVDLLNTNFSAWTVGNTSGSSATVTIANGGNLTTNATTLGQVANSTGTVLLTGTNSNWTIGTDTQPSGGGLIVGYFGNGNVSVTNGKELLVNGTSSSNIAVSLGDQAGSHGNLSLSRSGSNGSDLVIGGPLTNSTALVVGNLGTGTLSVDGSQSAVLTSSEDSNGVSVDVGRQAGSNGTVLLSNGGGLASQGALVVGDFGTGNISMSTGAHLDLNVADSAGVALYIGNNANSTGCVTLTGTGNSASYIVNQAGAYVIGNSGNGNLTIANGGYGQGNSSTHDGSGVAAYIGKLANSTGNVLVTDTNSIWDLSSGSLVVGNLGTGNLTVANGGSVQGFTSDLFTNSVYLGKQAGSSGTVLVTDPNTTWYITNGALVVGNLGTGNVNIVNGGNIAITSASPGFIINSTSAPSASVYLGLINGSSGTALVTGTGSKWSLAGALMIGDTGTGNLTIANGGNVTDTIGYVGTANVSSPGNSSATVTGANSTWINSGNLYVGGASLIPYGNGTLAISNGGNVSAANLVYGQLTSNFPNAQNGSVTVDGAGSSLNISGNLAGGGNLTISNGGNVTVGGHATENGYNGTTILVTDPNSNLTIQGYASIAQNANNALTIANGATVAVNGSNLTLAVGANSTGTLNLNSGGTLQIGGTNGIQAGSGTAIFNLSGGTLQVTGADLTTALNATFAVNTTSTLNTNGLNATWSGILSGSGNLTKTGTGTLTLAVANSYTGNATVSAGTLQLGAGGAAGLVAGNITDNAALAFNFGSDVTFSKIISGNGSVAINGTANVTLSGANNYTGVTAINSGTLILTANTTSLGNIANNGALIVNQGTSSALTNIISGNGTLTKSGVGNFTLFKANTFTGNTTISAGTLTIGNSQALQNSTLNYNIGNGNLSFGIQTAASFGGLSGNKNINLATTFFNPVALTVGGNNLDATYSGNLTGNGSLTKIGTGSLTLTGTSNFTGLATLSNGTLRMGSSLTLQSLTFNYTGGNFDPGNFTAISFGGLTGNQNLVLANDSGAPIALNPNVISATEYDGNISGTGSLTVTKILTLGGILTYTGGTTINATILTFTGDVSGLSGNILNKGSLSFNQIADTTYSGIISGNGSVSFSSRGNVTLAGANTYTGNTIVLPSTLILANAQALQNSTVYLNGGTINFNGITNATFGGLGGTQNLTLTNNASAPVTFTVGGENQDTAYSGNLAGTGSLTKTGNGTLTLQGVNTYAGATLINGGTINFSAPNSFGSNPNVTLNGGGLQWNNSMVAPLDVSPFVSFGSGNNTLDVNGLFVTLATAPSGNGNLIITSTVDGGSLNLTGNLANLIGNITNNATLVFSPSADASYSGTISGSGNLVMAGTNNLTLAGADTFSGNTTINSGTLILGHSAALQNSTLNLVAGGGNLSFGNLTSATIGSLSGNADLSLNNASSAGVALTVGTNNAQTIYSGNLSGNGTITKIGTGILTLNGTNTFTGNFNLNAGTLSLGNALVLQNSTVNYNANANLDFHILSEATFGGLSGNSTLKLDGLVPFLLTVGGNNQSTTFSGNLSGNGSLIKTGTGTLTLTSASNHFATAITYDFSVANGSIVLPSGANTSLPTSLLVDADGAVVPSFVVTGANATASFASILTGVASTGNLAILNGGFVNSDNTIGDFAGSNGSVIVDGANSQIKGNMFVGNFGNGNLTISNGGVIASNASVTSVGFTFSELGVSTGSNGAVLITGAGSQWNINGTSTIQLYIGQTGNGSLTVADGGKLSGGNFVLGGNTGGSGNVSVTDPNSGWNANSILIGNLSSGALTIANGGTVATNLMILSKFTGSSATVNLNAGGLLEVNSLTIGAGNYAFNMNGGALQVTSNNLSLAVNATLGGNASSSIDTNNFNATWTGLFSGNGSLAKIGNGTLTLTGNNAYAGDTVISAGTLTFTGSTSALGGNISDNATLIFNQSANSTFGGVISGSGALTQSGNSTLTLSGNNIYTGNTTVSAGTLFVSNNGTVSATGTGAVSVATNATLAGNGQVGGNTIVNGTLLPGTSGNAGLLSFGQNLTLDSGAVTLFQLGGATRGTQYSAINVANNLVFGGALTINLLNNFAPSLGTTFDLFQFGGSLSNTFAAITLPVLNFDLGWDTSQLTTTGDIATATINFTQWANTAALSGSNALPAAKPFGGPANLLRYTMNLDLTATPAGTPSLSTANISGVNSLVIQYRSRKNMTDCLLVPQYSTDLVNWTNVAAGNITQLSDADSYTAQYQASVPLPTNGSIFLRVAAQSLP